MTVRGQPVQVAVVGLRGRVVGRVVAAEDGSLAGKIIALGEDGSDMLAALAEALGMAEVDATAAERALPSWRGRDVGATLRCMCRLEQ